MGIGKKKTVNTFVLLLSILQGTNYFSSVYVSEKLFNVRWTKSRSSKEGAVRNMPIPTHMSAVQRFVNYLARYLLEFSELCEPLCRLTDENTVGKCPSMCSLSHMQTCD